jgi:hypothetical protein
VLAGCSPTLQEPEAQVLSDEQADAALNQKMAAFMDIYGRAITSNGQQGDDTALIAEFETLLADWDKSYNTNLLTTFETRLAAKQAATRFSGGGDLPLLNDLFFNKDGAIYLSGGGADAVGAILDFISPIATAGRYVHGAALDLNKFDPTNLEASCLETGGGKGACYETPLDWMQKTNVAVFNPVPALNQSSLDAAQNAMHYYCDPANTNMAYGFFKNYMNLFSVVTKDDTYYWYCTKVVWHIYNKLGIDIDSNTAHINWTTSGIYGLISTYYKTIYFWSSSKAKTAINNYITNVRNTLVLAEEIYFSPYVTKVYEAIRD